MNVADISPQDYRQPTAGLDVDPSFVGRWSPRAMSGQALQETEVRSLLEAARWAPSCFNAQPWRFAYVLRDSDHWAGLFETLLEGNRAWAVNAGALVAIVSRKNYEMNDKPAPTHSFDAGAAWMSLALQARLNGLVAHGMQGFDQDSARMVLQVPDVYDLPAIIAIGYPGDAGCLPGSYQAREQPSPRKPLDEIAFSNSFEGLES